MDLRRAINSFGSLLTRLGVLGTQPLMYVGGSDTLPPPLTKEEEGRAFSLLKTDPAAAHKMMIEHNLRLVVYIAKRFENTGHSLEDMVSIGTIGLIKAINTFDPEKNIKLATYASRCIENEILMFLRKTGNQKSEISFDEPLNTDWDGNELLLSDILGTDNDVVMQPIEDDIDRQILHYAVSKLPERDKTIISLRYGIGGVKEKTQKEVADLLGISQSYISRLEKRILFKLRKEILSMT